MLPATRVIIKHPYATAAVILTVVASLLLLEPHGFTTRSLAAASDPRVIEPARVFSLQKALPPALRNASAMVLDFVARPSGLYFLLGRLPREKAGGKRAVVYTTHSGASMQSILNLPGTSRRIDVWDGRVFVLSASGIGVYDERGRHQESLPDPGMEFCVLGGRVLGLTREGRVEYFGAGNVIPAGSVESGPYMRIGSLGEDRFVIVNGVSAHIYLGRVFEGVPAPFVPQRPEIRKAREAYRTLAPGQGVVLSALATNGWDAAYMVVAGHKISEGVAVIEIGQDGAVRLGYRFLSPLFPEYKTKHESAQYIRPSFIGISGKQFFIVDPRGFIAVYEL